MSWTALLTKVNKYGFSCRFWDTIIKMTLVLLTENTVEIRKLIIFSIQIVNTGGARIPDIIIPNTLEKQTF